MKRLWVLALVAAGCRSATDQPAPETPAPTPNKDARVFAKPDGQELLIQIYQPTKRLKPTFGILAIHGGGWVGGNRFNMDPIARQLADRGFLVASSEYRLAPRWKWPAQGEDVAAAAKYLRDNAKELGIDPNRMAAVGVSAGGHLSLWLGAKGLVQAVGSISGIHDLKEPLTPEGERFGIVQSLLPAMDEANLRDASPLALATKSCAPTYFIHGLSDPQVPTAHSTKAGDRLKELGVTEKVVLVEGMGHGLELRRPEERQALDNLATWLQEQLSKSRVIGG